MNHMRVRWGTSGIKLLALARCDGGSGQPASPAVTAQAVVVAQAQTAPVAAVEIAAVPTQAPAAIVSKPTPTPTPTAAKVAPTPSAVVVPKPIPTPPPAVTVAAATPPPPIAANAAAPAGAAADPDAAKALFRASDCTKCHAVDKVKKGPSLKKIAADLRGKAGAQDVVIKSITTGPTIKLADGTEEEHTIIDTKDPKELKNLADYILAH